MQAISLILHTISIIFLGDFNPALNLGVAGFEEDSSALDTAFDIAYQIGTIKL